MASELLMSIGEWESTVSGGDKEGSYDCCLELAAFRHSSGRQIPLLLLAVPPRRDVVSSASSATAVLDSSSWRAGRPHSLAATALQSYSSTSCLGSSLHFPLISREPYILILIPIQSIHVSLVCVLPEPPSCRHPRVI